MSSTSTSTATPASRAPAGAQGRGARRRTVGAARRAPHRMPPDMLPPWLTAAVPPRLLPPACFLPPAPRPTKYHVLVDENKFGPDALQSFIYKWGGPLLRPLRWLRLPHGWRGSCRLPAVQRAVPGGSAAAGASRSAQGRWAVLASARHSRLNAAHAPDLLAPPLSLPPCRMCYLFCRCTRSISVVPAAQVRSPAGCCSGAACWCNTIPPYPADSLPSFPAPLKPVRPPRRVPRPRAVPRR